MASSWLLFVGVFLLSSVYVGAATPSSAQVDSILREFYNSLGGPSWFQNTNWNTQAPYCTWFGLQCAPGTSTLLTIYLDSNNLVGTIPPTLSNLTTLTILRIGGNRQITGSLPDLGRSTNLTDLSVTITGLTGPFPTFISELHKLEYLDISSTSLSGTVPSIFQRLPRLHDIHIDHCHFEGSLPSFGKLRRLKALDASYNRFNGSLPNAWKKLKHLTVLLLGGSQFSGTVPLSLLKSKNLATLGIESNRHFEGFDLSSLYRLKKLQTLYANDMGVGGTIPTNWGKMPALFGLYLSGNGLTGTIPSYLTKFPSLTRLDLSNNQLTGKPPFSQSYLQTRSINLRCNNFDCVPTYAASISRCSDKNTAPANCTTCGSNEYYDYGSVTGCSPIVSCGNQTCGGCCDVKKYSGKIEPTCYLPAENTCSDHKLCPHNFVACKYYCYNPAVSQCCQNGQITSLKKSCSG